MPPSPFKPQVIIEDEKPEVEATPKEGSGSPAPKPSKEEADADKDEDEKPAIEIDSEDEAATKKQVKKEKAVKKEKVKKEKSAKKDTKKRKAPAKKGSKSAGSKEKKAKKEDTPREVRINLQQVSHFARRLEARNASSPNLELISLASLLSTQAVSLTFSIKYLSNFAKSTPLSDYVHVNLFLALLRLQRSIAHPPLYSFTCQTKCLSSSSTPSDRATFATTWPLKLLYVGCLLLSSTLPLPRAK